MHLCSVKNNAVYELLNNYFHQEHKKCVHANWSINWFESYSLCFTLSNAPTVISPIYFALPKVMRQLEF